MSLRHYAYVCAADGQPHPLIRDNGEWVYDITVDPPTFHAVGSSSSGCADRADWSSLEGGIQCSSLGLEASQDVKDLEEACKLRGSYDIPPSAGRPLYREDFPAYEACPVSCRNCWNCSAPANSTPPAPEGCTSGSPCTVSATGAFTHGLPVPYTSPRYPSSAQAGLLEALRVGKYTCVRGGGGSGAVGEVLEVAMSGAMFVKELSVVMRTSTPGASQVICLLSWITAALHCRLACR